MKNRAVERADWMLVSVLLSAAMFSGGPVFAAGSVSPSAVGFRDTTGAAGVLFTHKPGGYVWPFAGGPAVADFDEDGWDDVYVCNGSGKPNLLFRNNGDGTFTDIAKAAGVDETANEGAQGMWADFDGDGRLDLFVANQSPTPGASLYRNKGDGTFANVTTGAGVGVPQPYVGGVAVADYDRDGDLDIAFTAWIGSSVILRNNGGMKFSQVLLPGPSGELTGFGHAWQPIWVDIDHDGWFDLYVPIDGAPNRLFINDRKGGFTENAKGFGLDNAMNDMGVTLGDYDGDGELDIYITNIEDYSTYEGPGHNVMFHNLGNGRYEETSRSLGVDRGYWGWGTSFFDCENDGLQDIFEVNGWTAYPYDQKECLLWRNEGNHRYSSVGRDVNASPICEGRGLAAFDYDHDGRTDLMITTIGGRDYLLHNESESTNHWINVEVRDAGGRGFGESAEVVIRYEGGKQARIISSGSSFQSQEPLRAHFGLGSAEKVDEVLVRWPGVGLRRIFNSGVDRTLRISTGPLGDFNGDGRVDFADRANFAGCRSGTGIAHSKYSDCWVFDADRDGDVDDSDYAVLFASVGLPKEPACCPVRD